MCVLCVVLTPTSTDLRSMWSLLVLSLPLASALQLAAPTGRAASPVGQRCDAAVMMGRKFELIKMHACYIDRHEIELAALLNH